MNITDLVEQAHRIAVEHGFWATEDLLAWKQQGYARYPDLALKLILIHTEVSEAVEALRMEPIESYGNAFAEELADVVIRVADLCGALGIDLDTAVTVKMALNKTRPRKHGKAF